MSPAAKHSPQQQQQMVLDAAARCIENSSLLDFTMSAISKEAGLSMGSIYKHIQSKEDVLLALAARMYQNLRQAFAKVLALPLPMPQRLIALQLMDFSTFQLHSFDDQLEMLVSSEPVLARASDGWREKMAMADSAVEQLCRDSLIAAATEGELQAAPGQQAALVEEIMVGVWSLQVGFTQVARQRGARQFGSAEALGAFPLSAQAPIIKAQLRLLNSFPWQQSTTTADIDDICLLLIARGLR